MSNKSFQFQGKYIIKAELRCLTGLHIGGTQEGFEIGGIDNPVIKDPITKLPFIPGSALKGKMRSLLESALDKVFVNDEKREAPVHSCENDPRYKVFKNAIDKLNDKNKEAVLKEFKENISKVVKQEEDVTDEVKELEESFEEIERLSNNTKKTEEVKKEIIENKLAKILNNCPICQIFGASAGLIASKPTRLTVRDAFPKEETFKEWERWLGEGLYTELKTENAIDRITSEANPRTMERVPKDSVFEVEMIYDIYEDEDRDRLDNLFKAMALLEDSSLGGSGSRGYGKIIFEKVEVIERTKDYYLTGDKGEEKVVEVKIPFKNPKGNPVAELDYDKLELTWDDSSPEPIQGKSPAKYLLDNWRKELALFLFRKERLSFGKAAILARMSKSEFMELTRKKKIPLSEPTLVELKEEFNLCEKLAKESTG